MKTRATLLDIYLCMYMSVWAVLYVASEGKVSDACHGGGSFHQTYNDLQCDTGSQICITEVRYYQWHNMRDGCPFEIAAPVKSECCRHNTSRCSWVRQESDYLKHFQDRCSNRSTCSLHTLKAEKISSPCSDSFISAVSSVRSIHYTCGSIRTCHRHPPTTTTPVSPSITTTTTPVSPSIPATTTFKKTETTTKQEYVATSQNNNDLNNTHSDAAPKQEDYVTYSIAGGVVAGLVIIGVVVVGIILLRRRCQTLQKPLIDHHRGGMVEPVESSSTEVDYANPHYSLCIPDPDTNNVSFDRNDEPRISDMYSKVNKIKKTKDNYGGPTYSVQTTTNAQGDYDRIQGECVQFPVHGDYDHVVDYSNRDVNSDVITRDDVSNDVDMTYDQLHRGKAVTRNPELETDPYDILNRAKVER